MCRSDALGQRTEVRPQVEKELSYLASMGFGLTRDAKTPIFGPHKYVNDRHHDSVATGYCEREREPRALIYGVCASESERRPHGIRRVCADEMGLALRVDTVSSARRASEH